MTLCKGIPNVLGLLMLISLTACIQQPIKQIDRINLEDSGIDSQGISLSYGMIKKYLSTGRTTQADILRLFGSPNNMTTSSGGIEIWVYDKVRTELSSNSQRDARSIGIGISAGTNTVIGGAIGESNLSSSSTLVSSTNTLTVIMEFNKDNILINYSARQGRY